MECEKILQKICDDLAEDINSPVCQSIRNHLEGCPDCQQNLNSMRNTIQLFRCLEEREIPENIHQRLIKVLNIPDMR